MPADPAFPQSVSAVIFDVDGVLVDSPHERAWREALQGITDPARLTTEIYQAHVAGKPRLSGARAVLEQLGLQQPGLPDDAPRVLGYAERKQRRLEELIAAGEFTAFPDALRFVRAVGTLGLRLAVASSSKNANEMMRLIRVDPERTLLDVFAANVCGRDLRRGKPDPEIFLLAAAELGIAPAACLVVEDAPVGVEAAKAGGMVALGVARLKDEALLRAAGADLVVTSLDAVAADALAGGRLRARPE
jgi:beta-phosphoglucomutase